MGLVSIIPIKGIIVGVFGLLIFIMAMSQLCPVIVTVTSNYPNPAPLTDFCRIFFHVP